MRDNEQQSAAEDTPDFSSQPVLCIRARADVSVDRTTWPHSIPAVADLLTHGVRLGPATVLVGDNGTGKSTLTEAIAMAFGMNPEGGSTGAQHRSRPSESPLWSQLELQRGLGASRKGFFLRAETMHGFFTYLEDSAVSFGLHERSHGEAFLDLVLERTGISGLWILDEPESALSLPGCLALMGLLRDMEKSGSQILLSTHSPVLAAYPGARIYELSDDGLNENDFDSLELVRNWRGFLDAPERYLRHLDD